MVSDSLPDVTYTVERLQPKHLNSISTIFARAYHPTRPYQRQAIPDTPTTRAWWRHVFEQALEDAQTHVWAAVLEPCQEPGENVVGILRARRYEAGELEPYPYPGREAALAKAKESGTAQQRKRFLWDSAFLSEDHDYDMVVAFTTPMSEKRRELMLHRGPHFHIELLGVAGPHQHASQRPSWSGMQFKRPAVGAGTLLMRAHDLEADALGLPTYVECNEFVEPFYGRHGYVAAPIAGRPLGYSAEGGETAVYGVRFMVREAGGGL